MSKEFAGRCESSRLNYMFMTSLARQRSSSGAARDGLYTQISRKRSERYDIDGWSAEELEAALYPRFEDTFLTSLAKDVEIEFMAKHARQGVKPLYMLAGKAGTQSSLADLITIARVHNAIRLLAGRVVGYGLWFWQRGATVGDMTADRMIKRYRQIAEILRYTTDNPNALLFEPEVVCADLEGYWLGIGRPEEDDRRTLAVFNFARSLSTSTRRTAAVYGLSKSYKRRPLTGLPLEAVWPMAYPGGWGERSRKRFLRRNESPTQISLDSWTHSKLREPPTLNDSVAVEPIGWFGRKREGTFVSELHYYKGTGPKPVAWWQAVNLRRRSVRREFADYLNCVSYGIQPLPDTPPPTPIVPDELAHGGDPRRDTPSPTVPVRQLDTLEELDLTPRRRESMYPSRAAEFHDMMLTASANGYAACVRGSGRTMKTGSGTLIRSMGLSLETDLVKDMNKHWTPARDDLAYDALHEAYGPADHILHIAPGARNFLGGILITPGHSISFGKTHVFSRFPRQSEDQPAIADWEQDSFHNLDDTESEED